MSSLTDLEERLYLASDDLQRAAKAGKGILVDRGTGWTLYCDAISSSDWVSLKRIADTERSTWEQQLAFLSNTRDTIVRACSPANFSVPPFSPLPLRTHLDWQAVDLELRAELEKQGHSAAEVAQIVEICADAENPGTAMLSLLHGDADELDRVSYAHLVSLMGAIVAQAVAQLNIAESQRLMPPPADAELLSTCHMATDYVNATERRMQSALALNDFDAVLAIANQYYLGLSPAIAESTRIAAAVDASNAAVTMAASKLLRRQIRGAALARRILWLAAWPAEVGLLASWIDAASRLPSGFPAPDSPALSLPEAVANRTEGQAVRVGGWLYDSRPDPADSSWLLWRVEDGNPRSVDVEVRVPAVSPSSAGPSPYVRVEVSGEWRRAPVGPPGGDSWYVQIRTGANQAHPTYCEWLYGELETVCRLNPWGGSVEWTLQCSEWGAAQVIPSIAWFLRPSAP